MGANARAPQSHPELSAKLDVLARVIVRMGPPALLALAEVATLRLANEIAARVYRGRHVSSMRLERVVLGELGVKRLRLRL